IRSLRSSATGWRTSSFTETGAMIIWKSEAAHYWEAAQALRNPRTSAAARRLMVRELERLSAQRGRPGERARSLLQRLRTRQLGIDETGTTTLERALVAAIVALALLSRTC